MTTGRACVFPIFSQCSMWHQQIRPLASWLGVCACTPVGGGAERNAVSELRGGDDPQTSNVPTTASAAQPSRRRLPLPYFVRARRAPMLRGEGERRCPRAIATYGSRNSRRSSVQKYP